MQIEEARQRRIFDDHAVAGARVLAQHALDRIERAARDRHRCRRNAVGLELGGGEGDERSQFRRLAVEVRVGVQTAKRGIDRWQQRGVGVAGRRDRRRRRRPTAIAGWEVVGRSGPGVGCRVARAPPPARARGADDRRRRR